jgi:hypothetical protein
MRTFETENTIRAQKPMPAGIQREMCLRCCAACATVRGFSSYSLQPCRTLKFFEDYVNVVFLDSHAEAGCNQAGRLRPS